MGASERYVVQGSSKRPFTKVLPQDCPFTKASRTTSSVQRLARLSLTVPTSIITSLYQDSL